MSLVDVLLYLVVPVFVVGYLFLKRKYSHFEEQGIPHMTPTSWLLGNVSLVGKKYHFVDFIRQLYEETKGKDLIAGFYGSFVPTIIITDLELIKNITVKDFHAFTDRGMYVNEENEPITGNLFSLSGEKWRYLRNKLSPVFTSGKIKQMYSTISTKGENFVQAIKYESKLGSVDVKNISNKFTIDVVSSCAFGMEANTLIGENSNFVEIFKKIFGDDGLNQLKNLFIMGFQNASKFLKLRMFSKTIEDFFIDIVGNTIKYRESNNIERNDFLNMLIQLKNKGSIEGEISTENRKLTLNECVAQAFVFFFAGADSSSTSVAYAILELSHNLEVQEKLRKEITEKTKGSNGEITYDNLHEMTYLNQVMNGNQTFSRSNFEYFSKNYFLNRNAKKIHRWFHNDATSWRRLSDPRLEARY